jgi:hypothetical protein
LEVSREENRLGIENNPQGMELCRLSFGQLKKLAENFERKQCNKRLKQGNSFVAFHLGDLV